MNLLMFYVGFFKRCKMYDLKLIWVYLNRVRAEEDKLVGTPLTGFYTLEQYYSFSVVNGVSFILVKC